MGDSSSAQHYHEVTTDVLLLGVGAKLMPRKECLTGPSPQQLQFIRSCTTLTNLVWYFAGRTRDVNIKLRAYQFILRQPSSLGRIIRHLLLRQ